MLDNQIPQDIKDVKTAEELYKYTSSMLEPARKAQRIGSHLMVYGTVLGVINILCTYFVPALLHRRLFHHPHTITLAVEFIGLIFCIGFAIPAIVALAYIFKTKDAVAKKVKALIANNTDIKWNDIRASVGNDLKDNEKNLSLNLLINNDDFEKSKLYKVLKTHAKGVSKFDKAEQILTVIAMSMFVVSATLAITNLCKNYGYGAAHKSLNLPINIQCIIETMALALLLASSIVNLVQSVKNYRKEKASQLQNNDTSQTQAPKISMSTVAIPAVMVLCITGNVLGRFIAGLEGVGNLKVSCGGAPFPVGMTLRILCMAIACVISIHTIAKICEKQEEASSNFSNAAAESLDGLSAMAAGVS